MGNIFDDLPQAPQEEERFETILSRPGLRIERIVSTGQATPEDALYDQPNDEWVMLLAGAAEIWIEGEGELAMRPGEHLLIPAHRRHRVTRTAQGEPTVWLAVHLG